MQQVVSGPNVSFDRLKAFIHEAMVRLGLPDDDAMTVATLMAQADLQGSDGHGVQRDGLDDRPGDAHGQAQRPAGRGGQLPGPDADRQRGRVGIGHVGTVGHQLPGHVQRDLPGW